MWKTAGGARLQSRVFVDPRMIAPLEWRAPSLTGGGVQGVAGGADGADEVGVLLAVQRDAQAADMHVDGARLDIDVLAPHRIEELLAREDAAGMLHEMAQQ